MDALAFSQANLSLLNSLSSRKSLSYGSTPAIFNYFPVHRGGGRRKSLVFTARSCLNLPLEASSPAGRSLIGVLQNDPRSFYHAVTIELNRIIEDRDAAFARSNYSLGSPEAVLHRRIAKLKETECQHAVEDVLYTIILYKFSEIRVPLVPSLSRCLYNNRLEILPSKDWELESIHSLEALEMVREHLTSILGWKASSSVSVNWSPFKVQRMNLHGLYEVSVLYGYFLKSASMRFRLEYSLPQAYKNVPFGNWTPPLCGTYGVKNFILRQPVVPRSTTLSQVPSKLGKKEANLKLYVSGLDPRTRAQCARLKSKEAVNLIEKHCLALFTIDKAPATEDNESILTSLSSLKRLVLEAIAFGCFLWDAEQCVSKIYRLNERY